MYGNKVYEDFGTLHTFDSSAFCAWNTCTYMIINVDVVSGRDKTIMDVVSMEDDTCLDMADFE